MRGVIVVLLLSVIIMAHATQLRGQNKHHHKKTKEAHKGKEQHKYTETITATKPQQAAALSGQASVAPAENQQRVFASGEVQPIDTVAPSENGQRVFMSGEVEPIDTVTSADNQQRVFFSGEVESVDTVAPAENGQRVFMSGEVEPLDTIAPADNGQRVFYSGEVETVDAAMEPVENHQGAFMSGEVETVDAALEPVENHQGAFMSGEVESLDGDSNLPFMSGSLESSDGSVVDSTNAFKGAEAIAPVEQRLQADESLANSDDQGVTFLSGSVEQVNPTSGNFELDVDAQSTFDSFIGIEKWDEFQDSYEKEHAPATQTTFEFSSAVFEVVPEAQPSDLPTVQDLSGQNEKVLYATSTPVVEDAPVHKKGKKNSKNHKKGVAFKSDAEKQQDVLNHAMEVKEQKFINKAVTSKKTHSPVHKENLAIKAALRHSNVPQLPLQKQAGLLQVKQTVVSEIQTEQVEAVTWPSFPNTLIDTQSQYVPELPAADPHAEYVAPTEQEQVNQVEWQAPNVSYDRPHVEAPQAEYVAPAPAPEVEADSEAMVVDTLVDQYSGQNPSDVMPISEYKPEEAQTQAVVETEAESAPVPAYNYPTYQMSESTETQNTYIQAATPIIESSYEIPSYEAPVESSYEAPADVTMVESTVQDYPESTLAEAPIEQHNLIQEIGELVEGQQDEFFDKLDAETAPHYTEYNGKEFNIEPTVLKGIDVDHPERKIE